MPIKQCPICKQYYFGDSCAKCKDIGKVFGDMFDSITDSGDAGFDNFMNILKKAVNKGKEK